MNYIQVSASALITESNHMGRTQLHDKLQNKKARDCAAQASSRNTKVNAKDEVHFSSQRR